ncbi:hypothetical protein SDC9_206587 [bioreactor metagenome]|uniref:Uncharacterized protein n=1 Tax=bioreactor metagenome TaxID=1076179 RepID=A0A645J5H2_9ZZZZ
MRSLFAHAMRFPAFIAASSGFSAAMPPIASTTVSTSSRVHATMGASSPAASSAPATAPNAPAFCAFVIPINAGLNFSACALSNSILSFAQSATTLNLSPCAATTSSVCRPIEPVLPRIANLFIIFGYRLNRYRTKNIK